MLFANKNPLCFGRCDIEDWFLVLSTEFHAVQACIETINSASFASTSTELDEIENKMELHVTAIEQRTTSLQSSTRSMKKVVQRRSTADNSTKQKRGGGKATATYER